MEKNLHSMEIAEQREMKNNAKRSFKLMSIRKLDKYIKS